MNYLWLNSFLTSSSVFSGFQSGFRVLHSTKTALVNVTNDLLLDADRDDCSILVVLDISAALQLTRASSYIT